MVRGTGGGPEKTILLGTARTDPAKYAITVCYVRDQRDEVFHIDKRADGLPIDYVEIRERRSLDPGIWRPLRAIVRERRIDIVHAHEYKTDLLAWLLAKATPVIPLATSHGWTGHSARELRLYYPADRWLLARFPRVVAVSSEIKQTLVRAGADPAKVTVVLNGIDHVAFRREPGLRAEARARFGFGPDDVAIGAVGRLEPQKNFPLLLRAFDRLSGEFPRARLVIGGDGSLKAELDSLLATLASRDKCRLLGHVSDIAALHHALDALVQSSDYEGTPNAVLEAMAFETPLVATDVGGTAELARDGVEGLIVPPGNEEALVVAMRRL
jgi:glycosyltransferase involved in cell wall biosynthesis